ncbi:MAG TPA: hypothetical protein VGU67_00390 [Edaphobacter sp.]|nr:hypothetical protein [Edaphobacter sp.]
MKTNRYLIAGVLISFAALTLSAAHADFTYTETTQMTGGSMMQLMKMAGTFSKTARQAGEPVVSTVAIKGNRMTRVGPERTEIIDLDRETITSIDHQKRQYTVITFEQMRQQIEKAMQKAKEQQKKPADQDAASNADVKFQVHVRNTGATKEVAGLSASEAILTMAMDATDKTSGQTGSIAITNDLWLAAEIPGYDEVKDFYRRYAEKMKVVFSGAVNPAMFAQYPGAGQGMADMVKEMSKLKGTPVLQVMRMGTTANGAPLPAASEAPLPPPGASPAMPSAGDVAQQSATSAIASKMGSLGGLAGGFGGFGHKKKKADPAPAAAPEEAQAATTDATAAVLIESNTQLTAFSQAAADESMFAIPAGYKQVNLANSD